LAEPIRELSDDQDFKVFLEQNLDFYALPINKDFTASAKLLKAYEYFNGIEMFIRSYFDIEHGEISMI